MFENPPVLDQKGYFKVPEGPGLGITIRKEFYENS
jgi:L-alanine-DL-glutamate epimerase-like enolase superfamily enzyme